MPKLIVIIGITGNQGSSVATTFLKHPNYQVRGLTRDPTSPKARHLASQGIELIRADLNDISTLIPAFEGANLIFSVTNYWEPFFHPASRAAAAQQKISCREYAGQVEYQQGCNIADAANTTLETLDENGFLVSTLSSAKLRSEGKFKELYHFDAKADVFPGYVRDRYPELARKMSCIQTGFFMTSYRLATGAYFSKQNDGSFTMRFPTAPDAVVPHLDVNTDMGAFVYAVSQRAPGGEYMAEGTSCSWTDFLKTWCEVTGEKAVYKQITLEEMIENSPDKEFGREIGDMFMYSTDPGYDGGVELVKAEDIRKDGIDCPMTSLEDFMRKEDWTSVLTQ